MRKLKQPEHRCPVCKGRVSQRKALDIKKAKLYKGSIAIYSTGEMGRVFVDLNAGSELEIEEEDE